MKPNAIYTETYRNGCFDRAPYVQSFPATDSIRVKGLAVTLGRVQVPFRMAENCQYAISDLGQVDRGCDGCKWKDGIPMRIIDVPILRDGYVLNNKEFDANH